MFEMISYARQRLEKTVVMYGGEPVWVSRVLEDRTLRVGSIVHGKFEPTPISLDDPLLSFEPPEVGYVNRDSGAVFVRRCPMRRWKQGIDRHSLRINTSRVSEELFYSTNMKNCFMGRYPPFDEAVKRAKKIRARVAFHRLMAVDYDGHLFFRGTPMGSLVDGRLKLNTMFKCLENMIGDNVEDL